MPLRSFQVLLCDGEEPADPRLRTIIGLAIIQPPMGLKGCCEGDIKVAEEYVHIANDVLRAQYMSAEVHVKRSEKQADQTLDNSSSEVSDVSTLVFALPALAAACARSALSRARQ